MKIFLVLLSEILLALLFIYFASNNYTGEIKFENPVTTHLITITYVHFAAITYFIGSISALILYAIFSLTEKNPKDAYKKEREQNSIDAAEKDNTIQALENKVKTLEKALENVIKPDENK